MINFYDSGDQMAIQSPNRGKPKWPLKNLGKTGSKRSGVTLFSLVLLLVSYTLQAQTLNFSTGGATGRSGPSQTQINNAYSGTPLDGQITVSGGIQYWIIPQTGLYRIKAAGAQGGGAFG